MKNSFILVLGLYIKLICSSELQSDEFSNEIEFTTSGIELITTQLPLLSFVTPTKIVNQSRNPFRFLPKKIPESGDLNIPKSLSEYLSIENTNDASFYKDNCQFCPNVKFMQHYFARGCTAREVLEECKPKFCPKFFDCPLEEELPKNVCRVNQTDYKFGEHVPIGDVCQNCVCTNSSTGPMLACATTECFDSWRQLDDNCYRKPIDGQCCPQVICLSPNHTLPTCTFEGNTYRLGDYFSPQDNACYNCLCDHKWNQTDSPLEQFCSLIQCAYDFNRFQNRGCVPVYSDKACCPIYYHCPEEKSKQEQLKCQFGSNVYAIGQEVRVKQHKVCLECSCLIPPEITCRHKSCPVIPDNCTSHYIDGQCCPQIQCETENNSSNVSSVENMLEVSETQASSKCQFMDTCGESCELQLNNDNSSACPECQCDPSNDESNPVVDRAKHGRENPAASQVIQNCPDIICNFPCYIYRPSGDCPRCSCKLSKQQIQQIHLFASFNSTNVTSSMQTKGRE